VSSQPGLQVGWSPPRTLALNGQTPRLRSSNSQAMINLSLLPLQGWFDASYDLEVWRGTRQQLQQLLDQGAAPSAGHQVGAQERVCFNHQLL
jgi:hypothetical protein